MKIFGRICFVLLNLFIVYQLGCKEQLGGEIAANMPMGTEVEEVSMPMGNDDVEEADVDEVVGAPVKVSQPVAKPKAAVPASQKPVGVEKRVAGLEGKMKKMDNKIRSTINRYKEGLRKKFREVNSAYRKILQKLSTVKERAREAIFSGNKKKVDAKKNERKK